MPENRSYNLLLRFLRASDPGASQVVMIKEVDSFAKVISLVLYVFIHRASVYLVLVICQDCFRSPEKAGSRQLGPSSLAVYFLQANASASVGQEK